MAGNDTWAAVSLLETTWQADMLQINEERLSISGSIRHSLPVCHLWLHSQHFLESRKSALRIPE